MLELISNSANPIHSLMALIVYGFVAWLTLMIVGGVILPELIRTYVIDPLKTIRNALKKPDFLE